MPIYEATDEDVIVSNPVKFRLLLEDTGFICDVNEIEEGLMYCCGSWLHSMFDFWRVIVVKNYWSNSQGYEITGGSIRLCVYVC